MPPARRASSIFTAPLACAGKVGGRLARQRMIDGSLDITAYRGEIAAADAARVIEEAYVPPAVDRALLQEKAMVVAQEAAARFYAAAIVELERQHSAWTPAAVDRADGGNDDDTM